MNKKQAICGFAVFSIAIALTVAALASPQFAGTQRLHYLTSPNGSGCNICVYNYTTTDMYWEMDLMTSGYIEYDLPTTSGQWLGFWTYDITTKGYVDVAWVQEDDY